MEAIYRKRLTILWWACAALVFLLVMIRLIAGSDDVPALVKWLTIYLLPGLGLVSGAAATKGAGQSVDADLAGSYGAAMIGSIIYLVAIAAGILTVILTTGAAPDALLGNWGALLGLIQALILGLLGRFFAKTSPGTDKAPPSSEKTPAA